jgi:outer membrane lipoprotein-sorting protein
MYWKKISIIALVAMALLGGSRFSRAGDDQAAQETVERISHLLIAKSSIATLTMQITNESGEHDLSMKVWSAGGEDVLLRILTPQAEANTAVLKIDNDVWYYLPKTNRIVKVPSAMTMNTWMGSDFTVDDLVKESFLSRDYIIANSYHGDRGGIAVDEYTMTPQPDAVVVWGKIVLQVRQDNGMPTRQSYFDEDGKLLRELIFSDYKTMDGRLIPTRLLMRPTDKPAAETTIVYDAIVFDALITDGTFAVNNLPR